MSGFDRGIRPRELAHKKRIGARTLSRVEEVVRDPQTGARRARVLKRWAERQMARARKRAAGEVSTRMKAISNRRNEGRDKKE